MNPTISRVIKQMGPTNSRTPKKDDLKPFPIEFLQDSPIEEVVVAAKIAKQANIPLSKEGEIPSSIEKRTLNMLSSPKKIEKVVKKQEEGKKLSLAEQFGMGIGGLLPQLIGGVVGGLIGGDEGFIEGAEAGQAVENDARAAQEAERQAALKEREMQAKESQIGMQESELAQKEAFGLADIALKERELKLEQEKNLYGLAFKGIEQKPLTENQSKARMFGTRMNQAENEFNDIFKNFDPTTTKQRFQGKLPAEMQSDEFLRYEQAKKNFLTAVLRKESGAAISDTELEEGNAQYFPEPGDSAGILAQKKRNRDLVTSLMLEEGGVQMGQSSVIPQANSRIETLKKQITPEQARQLLAQRKASR
jgi:hypothetical protein